MPANAISPKRGPLPIMTLGRKLRPHSLVANPIITERHPFFVELFQTHSDAIILNYESTIAFGFRNADAYFGSTSVPSISDQFGESNFWRLRNCT